MAGGKVIQADYALVELKQGFEQIAAYEAGDTGNEPGFWLLAQFDSKLFVAGHLFGREGDFIQG